MTAPTPSRCTCTHSRWRHAADTGRCFAPGCRCQTYRPQPAGQLLADARTIATGSLTTVMLGVAVLGVAVLGFAAARLLDAVRPLGVLLYVAAYGALR